VSRTIGDRDGKKGGVISEPEVSRIVVADTQPGFRITLASDGLWDAASVKQGKYFPFTTFRRLIAHTRLTLFFYNQAAQCSGKLAAAAAAAALCKLAQVRAFPNHHITKD
jgi:serine/threonine protein phosphatase PrpC